MTYEPSAARHHSATLPAMSKMRRALGRFEATMTGTSEEDRERFYNANMAELMGTKITVRA